MIGKPEGHYITLECEGVRKRDPDARIAVGTLLGVEEPIPQAQEPSSPELTEKELAAVEAIAARYAKSDRRIFIMSSDGDLNEGSSWEAIMFAAQEKLDNLTMIVDYNQVQALGHSEDVIDLRSLKRKLEEFGWNAVDIDGHNVEEIYETLSKVPLGAGKPSAVICHTIKCKGIPAMEDTVRSHYKFVANEDLEAVIKAIEEG